MSLLMLELLATWCVVSVAVTIQVACVGKSSTTSAAKLHEVHLGWLRQATHYSHNQGRLHLMGKQSTWFQ